MQRLTVLALSLTLAACVDLSAVRDYAGESARLTAGYTTLTTRYRDTFDREAPYLTGAELEQAKANDAKRQAVYADLLRVRETVAHYLATLAKLAGDDDLDLGFGDGVERASQALTAHPDLGLDAARVAAFAELGKLASADSVSFWRQSAVRDTLRAGQAPFQTSIAGMRHLLGVYRKSLENERRSVLGPFEVELALADPDARGRERLLDTLARVHLRDRQREYDLAEQRIVDADRALGVVADGHTRLFDSADDLTRPELRAALKAMGKDLKQVRKQLQAF